eukprot:299425-Pyramimonas_sp.AAC.1
MERWSSSRYVCLPSCDWFSRGVYTASPPAIGSKRTSMERCSSSRYVCASAQWYRRGPMLIQYPPSRSRCDSSSRYCERRMRARQPIPSTPIKLQTYSPAAVQQLRASLLYCALTEGLRVEETLRSKRSAARISILDDPAVQDLGRDSLLGFLTAGSSTIDIGWHYFYSFTTSVILTGLSISGLGSWGWVRDKYCPT